MFANKQNCNFCMDVHIQRDISERIIKGTKSQGNQNNVIQGQKPDMENRQTQQRT